MSRPKYQPPTVGELAKRGMVVELWCAVATCLHNVAVSAADIADSVGPKTLVRDAAKGYRCPRCGSRNTAALSGPPPQLDTMSAWG